MLHYFVKMSRFIFFQFDGNISMRSTFVECCELEMLDERIRSGPLDECCELEMLDERIRSGPLDECCELDMCDTLCFAER